MLPEPKHNLVTTLIMPISGALAFIPPNILSTLGQLVMAVILMMISWVGHKLLDYAWSKWKSRVKSE